VSEILDLPLTHTRVGPVFVIGAARSGTSLLSWLVRRYLKVNFGTESQFIIRFYRRLPEYGDLQDTRNLRRLIDDIAQERCFERWTIRFGFVLDRQRVVARAESGPRSYSQVLQIIFGELAHFHEMSRWGDKTPAYNHDLPILLSLFPDAQFVHIIRDGRDVALSSFRTHFGAGNVYRAALDWRRAQLRIHHFAASLRSEQILTIHYEELLSRPVETLEALARFFGIRGADPLLESVRGDIVGHIRAGNCGKWRDQLSIPEQRLFETVAGCELRMTGYATLHDVSGRLGSVQRFYWELDHRLRKTLRRRSWADNVYRAAVRLRMAGISARG
jgi:hypothetical protein